MLIQDVLALLPELIIFVGAMILLMLTVFVKHGVLRAVTITTVAILLIALIAAIFGEPSKIPLLYNQIANDSFARLSKLIVLSISVLLSLFMGLELQSLSLYVMTAIRRDDTKCSEAGVKYFLLGSLATGIMLYGMTFIYGTVGNIGFGEIKVFLKTVDSIPMTFYLGMGLVIAGTVFKISAVPFHMWAPDVYEGAPTTVVSFFASVPKIAAFCMMTRLLVEPMLGAYAHWRYMIAVLAVITMIVGVFGALNQHNIKRLLAYSSIMNMG